METLELTQKELQQVSIFEKLKKKEITQKEAAKRLDLSTRQIIRKLKGYKRSGPESLAHKGRGKAGNHSLDPILKMEAMELVVSKYPDFGPTLAAEKLWEDDRLKINPETLRLLMVGEGVWKPKQQRKVEQHFWRERKDCLGEMVQLDGSPHAWFEDRAPKCTLIAFIDDATSTVLWLEFAQSESTESLMVSTRGYLEHYGKPLSFYADRGSVYKVNTNNPNQDKLTQYGRAMKELHVRLISARSPQAKGRVERLFGTLQDRLVKELRLRSISTIEEANRFLVEEYLAKHNERFSVVAKKETDLHSAISRYNLDDILCLKEERIIRNDFTVSYNNRWFQLAAKQPTILRPKTEIEIWENFNNTVSLHLRGMNLNFEELVQKPSKGVILKEMKERVSHKPAENHPWRQSWKKEKEDISILEKSDISILE